VQIQIAREMISPSSGANSILQLNMGEGKSSVIVPIVAAALADGKKLVRVVVLKPLSTQMFHVLLRKLGGLLGRRIFHMPISRSVRLDVHKARQIRNLCEECMHTGGILLVQPEHLLSFELMGLERLLSGESELGNVLTQTQLWLEDNSRDILDESDEILSVRFELVYTMGLQRAVEFSPDRWTIIEHVLGLVSRFAQSVLQLFPQGLELRPVCTGGFPRVRILMHSATDKLLEMVAREVCEEGLPGVRVSHLPQHVRAVLFRFLTDLDMREADTEPLQHHVFGVDSMRRSLLLLKGLIAGGVLAFALQQKRWRVNYGLDLSRTMLATLHTEFRRLAEDRKWKRGSNSKLFEKAWGHCFGPEVPVGCNIDRRESRTGAQHGTDNDEFSSMLHSLQSLGLDGGATKRAPRVQRVGAEFVSYYGNDAHVTERWQALCQDCGVNPVPPSIKKCKKVQPLPAMRLTGFL